MFEAIPNNATPHDLASIAADLSNSVVAFDKPPSERLLAAVEKAVFRKRPDIGLRMSNWYGGYFDLKILKRLPSLRCLQLAHAGDLSSRDLDRIAELPNLNSLSLELTRLPHAAFFERLPATLEYLRLGETHRAKGSIAFLRRFGHVKKLSIIGPARDVEVIGTLTTLRALHLQSITSPSLGFLEPLQKLRVLNLQSITSPSLAFLEPLQKLRELRLALGGTASLRGVEDLPRLEYLEIWMVRKLASLRPIAQSGSLRFVFLQDLRNITSMPDCGAMLGLRTVQLQTMKGLRDLRGLARAPNLERFSYVAATQTPRVFHPLLKHPRLRLLAVNFYASKRREEAFAQIVRAHGKNPDLTAFGEAEQRDPTVAPDPEAAA
jgi:hypothetical protein